MWRNEAPSQIKPFSVTEGVDISAVPLFEEVFEIVRDSVQRIRATFDLPPQEMQKESVRLIPLPRWEEYVSTEPDKNFFEHQGYYFAEEDGCFLPHLSSFHGSSPSDIRDQHEYAKTLTHEIVHYGSHAGVADYSSVLNEGITESVARRIFLDDVGPIALGRHTVPTHSYQQEVKLWHYIRELRPKTSHIIERAYWSRNPLAAQRAVKNNFGAGIALSLEADFGTHPDVVSQNIQAIRMSIDYLERMSPQSDPAEKNLEE